MLQLSRCALEFLPTNIVFQISQYIYYIIYIDLIHMSWIKTITRKPYTYKSSLRLKMVVIPPECFISPNVCRRKILGYKTPGVKYSRHMQNPKGRDLHHM